MYTKLLRKAVKKIDSREGHCSGGVNGDGGGIGHCS